MSVSFFSLLGLALLFVVAFVLFKLVQGLVWVLKHAFRGIGFLVRHVVLFVRAELVGTIHAIGALLTAVAILPLTVVNLAIGRFSSARYYGRALKDEGTSFLLGI